MTAQPFDIGLRINQAEVRRGGGLVADGLSLALAPGDGVTIRGANGTGKTSILRMIAGFSGARIDPVQFTTPKGDLDASEVRATSIHWLGGEDGLSDRLSVEESLCYWRDLQGGGPMTIEAATARVGLPGLARRRAGTLSTGQRRRLGLARLLLSPRAIWLLDEPMSGLDPAARALVLEVAAAHRASGGLVVMATHDDGLPGTTALSLQPQGGSA